MNRDLIILLKSIYHNVNDRKHHILQLDEIVSAFNQNKLQVEQMMAVEEDLLKYKVNQPKHLLFFFSITVSDVKIHFGFYLDKE